MDDPPNLPPNTSHYFLDKRLVAVRESGRDLRFVVTARDRAGYELGVKFLDQRGDPQRQWLMYDNDREKLEQIRLALEAQEPGSK